MKRWALLPITALTVLLTVTVLPHTGWLSARSARPAQESAAGKETDPILTEAGWRWRNGQPTHWRACVLQR